jgi:murein DD-endopeptidase MepM/ murein hydrolase activator NlpD
MEETMKGPGRRVLHAVVAGAAAAAVLSFLCCAAPGAGAQEDAGPVVKLAYRALEPGEPVLVTLTSDGTARSASVAFLGRTAALKPAPGSRTAMAFLGIDLAVKPGPHPMVIRVDKTTGETEEIHKDIEIGEKTFPFTKLRFKPEYVTPPKEVQERIRRESELVALIMSIVTPEWLGDGPFVMPHPAPTWSNFGQRRLNNNILQSIHAGLDIRVPFGEPIRAANAGRIAMASHLYFGGKTVIIDHGLGVFSSYGHLSELKVKRGEAVGKGEVVGLCGSTGRSTGPHLHWAVKIFDARVDPEAMLRLPL